MVLSCDLEQPQNNLSVTVSCRDRVGPSGFNEKPGIELHKALLVAESMNINVAYLISLFYSISETFIKLDNAINT